MAIQKEFQKGRSMVEMLAVIMIIGVLTVGALAGFTQAMQKFNVGKMHNDIQSISSEVVNLFAWQRSYPNDDTFFQTEICNSVNNIFPDGCNNDGKGINPFGGIYTVTPNPTNQTLTISATGLPEEACEDLTIQEWAYVVGTPTCCITTDSHCSSTSSACTDDDDTTTCTFTIIFE